MGRCLGLASIALVRDRESEVAAAQLAPNLHIVQGVDLAFLLAGREPSTGEDKLVVLVLPYGQLDAYGAAAQEDYFTVLAEAIDTLPAPHRPARVQILGMYSGRQPNDVNVARELAQRVRTLPVETTMVFTPSDALREISSARAVLTGRYHALLFAYLAGTPVGAISHQPKITSLCRVTGMPQNRWLTFEEALVDGALRRLIVTIMSPVPLPGKRPELRSAAMTALRRFLDDATALAVAAKSR